jgi:hypothetical protein
MPVTAAALLAAILAAAPDAGADAYAVVAVGDAPAGPDTATLAAAAELRAACGDRSRAVVADGKMRALLAPAAPAALADAERDLAAAERALDDGAYDAGARALRSVVDALEVAPPSVAAHALRVRALARLGYAEKLRRDAGAMAAALDRLVAAAPEHALDPVEYPPSYVKELDAARRRAAARSRIALAVNAGGAAAVEVFVDGRPVGAAPVTVPLAPGRHRVEGVSGELRVPPAAVTAERDPLVVELDTAAAAALRADGAGLASAPGDRAARLARVAAWLGAAHVVAVTADARFVAAALHDAGGVLVRDGRVRVEDGRAAALGALAAFLLTGEASPEVLPAAKLDLAPRSAPPLLAVGASARTGRAWMRPAAYAATGLAVALGGLAAYEGVSARNGFRSADALLAANNQFLSTADRQRYDDMRAGASRDRTVAFAAAGGAAAFAIGAGVLGVLSWDHGAPVVRF